MTSLVHVGIRPKYKLVYQPDKAGKRYRKTYHETLPNGGYKIWTARMLKSGCGHVIDDIIRLEGLIYCPKCDEYFSESQFKEK